MEQTFKLNELLPIVPYCLVLSLLQILVGIVEHVYKFYLFDGVKLPSKKSLSSELPPTKMKLIPQAYQPHSVILWYLHSSESLKGPSFSFLRIIVPFNAFVPFLMNFSKVKSPCCCGEATIGIGCSAILDAIGRFSGMTDSYGSWAILLYWLDFNKEYLEQPNNFDSYSGQQP